MIFFLNQNYRASPWATGWLDHFVVKHLVHHLRHLISECKGGSPWVLSNWGVITSVHRVSHDTRGSEFRWLKGKDLRVSHYEFLQLFLL